MVGQHRGTWFGLDLAGRVENLAAASLVISTPSCRSPSVDLISWPSTSPHAAAISRFRQASNIGAFVVTKLPLPWPLDRPVVPKTQDTREQASSLVVESAVGRGTAVPSHSSTNIPAFLDSKRIGACLPSKRQSRPRFCVGVDTFSQRLYSAPLNNALHVKEEFADTGKRRKRVIELIGLLECSGYIFFNSH